MDKMMKAIVWNGKPWFEGLSYEDFPVPEYGGDWVLVRNNVCGICGSDLHFFSGMQDGRFPAKNLPAVFGHEDASTVVAAVFVLMNTCSRMPPNAACSFSSLSV